MADERKAWEMEGLAWALKGLSHDWLDGMGLTKIASMTVGPERYDPDVTGIARMLQPVGQPAAAPPVQPRGKAS